MEKELWKDEVLTSLKGLERAEPNPFLFSRIEARLQAKTGLSKFQVRLAGVAMLLLLAINLWLVAASKPMDVNPNALTTTYRF